MYKWPYMYIMSVLYKLLDLPLRWFGGRRACNRVFIGFAESVIIQEVASLEM